MDGLNYTALEERILDALDIASEFGHADGAHHKMWVIDQMVRALTGDGYDEWISVYCHAGDDSFMTYMWDEGVAP